MLCFSLGRERNERMSWVIHCRLIATVVRRHIFNHPPSLVTSIRRRQQQDIYKFAKDTSILIVSQATTLIDSSSSTTTHIFDESLSSSFHLLDTTIKLLPIFLLQPVTITTKNILFRFVFFLVRKNFSSLLFFKY